MPNQVTDRWPTLAWLRSEDEWRRRWWLRFHKETPPGDVEDRRIRENLDRELGRLGRLELQAEASSGDAQQRALDETIEVNREFADLIHKSPAFSHYLDSYLYFKIRFAAGRWDNPYAPRTEAAQAAPAEQWNDRPVGLPTPPDLRAAGSAAPDPGLHAALRRCELRDESGMQADVDRFLGLRNAPAAGEALMFLDGFVQETDEAVKFELWLRGLYPRAQHNLRFETLAQGLYEWSKQHYEFYLELERRRRAQHVRKWLQHPHAEGTWHARNPLAARCGVTDLYWLAKILRAEVSPRGVVTYVGRSWLYYLPALSPGRFPKEQILRIEDVLRATFDYACELIQNAVEMAEYCETRRAEPLDYPSRPSGSSDWRPVQDVEIDEISAQRTERLIPGSGRTQGPRSERRGVSGNYWSERIRTGEYEENLVGVALSGGGIRSATFALGVLQRLKDLDFLRQVDYLSTVSGGGYIGSWLVGNVRRSRYFLSRMTSWEESIVHLRRYSKYLAPQSGFLSADSWVIWGTWIRNATVIQLTAVAWLWLSFVAALALKSAFDWAGGPSANVPMHVVLTLGFVAVGVLVALNLAMPSGRSPTQHTRVVLLAWCGSFLSAALLWARSSQQQPYSDILAGEWKIWPWYLAPSLLLAMWGITLVSFLPGRRDPDSGPLENSITAGKYFGSLAVASLSSGVIYFAICGVRYLFGWWASWGRDRFEWYAYVFGPSLVLVAISVAVIVFIGLMGRTSADWRREWWTRYGSWLTIYGVAFLGLAVTSVFGYVLLLKIFRAGQAVKWGAVGGWIASVAAGLLAGNSEKTNGQGEGSSKALEWVAPIGGVLFIVGAVLALSSVLHLLLVQIWLPTAGKNWWDDLNDLRPGYLLVTLAALLFIGLLFSWRFNLNIFGLNQFYRNRLVRCYLGGTRWKPGLRQPDRFTAFDEGDDLSMTELQFDFDSPRYSGEHYRGPFPIVNCALNLGGSSDLTVKTRQSTCFLLTPLTAGAARARVGFVPMPTGDQPGFAGGVTLGEAISISGAAASPNMGYNTSPLVSVLLTMFNVRLAWWFPNPGGTKWQKGSSPLSLLYLVQEFLGLADETSDYVNVSDGGHFENLAIYELIRRRAKVIIASDAECDPELTFGSLGNLIRICETDFGAKIDIDVASIRKQENGCSRAHCAVGRIAYSNGSLGYLIYLKSSMTGDEDADIEQYHAVHPDFPHQSTGDQFFTEDQFESYRRLGHHITSLAFRDAESGSNLVDIASKLYDVWTPAGFSNEAFVKHAAQLDGIWERFRSSTDLLPLLQELMADRSGPPREAPPSHEELAACLELAQLMENVFLDLRLDDFWDHPDNRGWAMLFMMWAKSPTFRSAWSHIRRTFGIRFEYFCQQHLGLEKDHPVVRV